MDLYVYEFTANSVDHAYLLSDSVFEIKTCQRTLLLSLQPLIVRNCRRSFSGTDAYEHLLRFSCGLESQIKGETDVFGQIKTAFRNLREANPALADELQSISSRLFEDTKEIRTGYLQGVGGNTYGALARRLLNPLPPQKVLILGAGQISKSVAPYFADSSLTIFNRSTGRLLALASELSEKGYSRINFIQDEASLSKSMEEADLILLGTPANCELDYQVMDVLAKKNQHARVLHLGGEATELTHFEPIASRFASLSELFAMEKEQNLFREKQVQQALEACRHRAILRSMSRSISLAHGWEDLALFY